MKAEPVTVAYVTYKEVMIFWGSTPRSAQKRLNLIRNTLGKSKFHRLTVSQFCQAEDISPDEFNKKIADFYNK